MSLLKAFQRPLQNLKRPFKGCTLAERGRHLQLCVALSCLPLREARCFYLAPALILLLLLVIAIPFSHQRGSKIDQLRVVPTCASHFCLIFLSLSPSWCCHLAAHPISLKNLRSCTGPTTTTLRLSSTLSTSVPPYWTNS